MKKDTNPSATISCWLDDSIIGKAAREVSEEYHFPLETATFSALVIASHAVGSAYTVQSPGKPPLPVALYGIAEQPSNAGKSGLTERLYAGYSDRASIINEEVSKEREQLKRSLAEKSKGGVDIGAEHEREMLQNLFEIPIGVSDPTPEGLESSLVEYGGFFIAYSTEQGLSKTLLGGMYSDGAKKDDLVLKGFNGEYHKVVRANKDRITFSGRPYGGVFELSQEGTIARIMSSAGTTGISERFLMIREDDLIGTREYLDKGADLRGIILGEAKITSAMLKKATPVKRLALEQYTRQMAQFADIRFQTCKDKGAAIHALEPFTFEQDAWVTVLAAKQLMEDAIGEEKARNSFLASMRGKIDLQIMKVAATIHAMDWDIATHGKIGNKITAHTVRKAYAVVDALFMGVKAIADGNGLYGDTAESEFIIDYLQGRRGQQVTLDKLCKNIQRIGKQENPFRFYSKRGQASEKIRETVQKLVAEGRVFENRSRTPAIYSA